MLKVLAFYSAYTQSANSRRTGRPVVDVFSNFFRSMATWPGPVADTVAKWPHACLSARHKATNAPTDRPPLFETSRSRSAAAPRGTRVAREERFGRQVRRRQNKCPLPHFCRRISKVFGVSRSRLGVRRAARWFRARSSVEQETVDRSADAEPELYTRVQVAGKDTALDRVTTRTDA